MSKTGRWVVKKQQDIKLRYDFEGEHQLRALLEQELRDMVDQHENFMDLSGSLHNSSFEEADWQEVE